LDRDNNVMDAQAERIVWLRRLGLNEEARAAFDAAVSADRAGLRRNQRMILLGTSISVDAGGARALKAFIRDFDLAGSTDPDLQFELANAWLKVGDHVQARACVERATTSPDFVGTDLASPWLARAGRSYLLISALALRAGGETAAADRQLDQLETLLARMLQSGVRTSGIYDLR